MQEQQVQFLALLQNFCINLSKSVALLRRATFIYSFPVVSSQAVNSLPCGRTFFRAKKAFLCVDISIQSEPILGWQLLAVVKQLLVRSKLFPITSIPKAPLEKVWQGPDSSQLHPIHLFSFPFLSSTGRSKALPWQLHGDLLGISFCYGSLTVEKDAVQSVCLSSLYPPRQ